MRDNTRTGQYGVRKRIWMGALSVLIVLGNVYVIYLESRLPFDYYVLIGAMIVCSILLVHVFGYIAVTGRRPGYLQSGQTSNGEDNESG